MGCDNRFDDDINYHPHRTQPHDCREAVARELEAFQHDLAEHFIWPDNTIRTRVLNRIAEAIYRIRRDGIGEEGK